MFGVQENKPSQSRLPCKKMAEKNIQSVSIPHNTLHAG